MAVAPLLASAPGEREPIADQADLRCEGIADVTGATADAAKAMREAVAALPADQQSSDDIEAAILFTLSQHNWCSTVITAGLRDLRGSGTPETRGAVLQVLASLQRNAGVGTAGFNTPGLFVSSVGTNSFFTGPLVGVGGGSATYTD